MDRVHNHLGVKKEVSSFVLPIGATIMDGTAVYSQAVAVFIAQAFETGVILVDQLELFPQPQYLHWSGSSSTQCWYCSCNCFSASRNS